MCKWTEILFIRCLCEFKTYVSVKVKFLKQVIFFAGIPAQNADVWFLDRSLRWHLLAESFLFYYRMMLVHLGLPQWQYAFTDIGLSYSAKVLKSSTYLLLSVIIICIINGLKYMY